MRARSMRQVQMSRASRAVRHIEKRPKLLDVNRTTWKRFQQPNVALPSSQGVLRGRGAPSSAALHDRQQGYNPIRRAPAFTQSRSVQGGSQRGAWTRIRRSATQNRSTLGVVAETPAGSCRPPRTRATDRAPRTPPSGSTPHTAPPLADGGTLAPSRAGVSSRKMRVADGDLVSEHAEVAHGRRRGLHRARPLLPLAA